MIAGSIFTNDYQCVRKNKNSQKSNKPQRNETVFTIATDSTNALEQLAEIMERRLGDNVTELYCIKKYRIIGVRIT